MRPVRQGTLDGMCGVCSVVNAVSVALGLTRRSSFQKDLFIQLTHGLGASALLSAMHEGLEADELLRASRHAFTWIECEYGFELGMFQPFNTERYAKLPIFLDALREKLATPDTGIIIQLGLTPAHSRRV